MRNKEWGVRAGVRKKKVSDASTERRKVERRKKNVVSGFGSDGKDAMKGTETEGGAKGRKR